MFMLKKINLIFQFLLVECCFCLLKAIPANWSQDKNYLKTNIKMSFFSVNSELLHCRWPEKKTTLHNEIQRTMQNSQKLAYPLQKHDQSWNKFISGLFQSKQCLWGANEDSWLAIFHILFKAHFLYDGLHPVKVSASEIWPCILCYQFVSEVIESNTMVLQEKAIHRLSHQKFPFISSFF